MKRPDIDRTCPECRETTGLLDGDDVEPCSLCLGSGKDPHAEIAELKEKLEKTNKLYSVRANEAYKFDVKFREEREAHKETKRKGKLLEKNLLYFSKLLGRVNTGNARLQEVLELISSGKSARDTPYTFLTRCKYTKQLADEALKGKECDPFMRNFDFNGNTSEEKFTLDHVEKGIDFILPDKEGTGEDQYPAPMTIESLHDELKQIKADNENLQFGNTEMKRELDISEIELNVMTDNYEFAKDNAKSENEVADELDDENDKLKEKLKQVQVKLLRLLEEEKSNRASLSYFPIENSKLKKELKQKEKERIEYCSDRDELKLRIEYLESMREKYRDEIWSLKAERDEVLEEEEGEKIYCHAHDIENCTMCDIENVVAVNNRKTCLAKEKNKGRMKHELVISEVERNELKKENTELEDQIARVRKNNMNWGAKYHELETDRDELKEKLKQVQTANHRGMTELWEAQAEIKSKDADATALKDEVFYLKNQLKQFIIPIINK